MNQVTLNPRAELVLRGERDAVSAVTLMAPVRGAPLRTTTVDRSEGSVFEVLSTIAEGGALDLELDDATWGRLEEIGLLVPAEKVSRKTPFTCSMAPGSAVAAWDPTGLVVNPTFSFDGGVGAPAETWVDAPSAGRKRAAVRGTPRVNGFAADAAWARLCQDAYAAPVWLSIQPEERDALSRLEPWEAPPADLDPSLAARLVECGALIRREDEVRRGEAFRAQRAAGAACFAKDRYALLRQVLQPTWVRALRAHYETLVSEGYAAFDTTLGRNRYCMHNEPISRVVHQALTRLVSEIAGQAVKPSYAYFGAYREGATLVRHRDRDQCPISISLLIDYQPEPGPQGEGGWPLCLAVPRPGGDENVEALLAPGDGLFFDGTRLDHWRGPLPAGHRSTSLFLHYVPAGFEGGLD